MSAAVSDAVSRFAPHRDRLFGVAYRMTGSVADAEDCVQESFVRWQRTDVAHISNDEAYLVRVVTRLAIDRQRAAARRRETYVGPWLPEPLVRPIGATRSDDPADLAAVADSLSFAFLVMLDELSAAERAAFILHDVFGFAFDDIAATLDRDVVACRQLASRARRKLRSSSDAPDGAGASAGHGPAGDATTITTLLGCLASGDIDGCLALLAPGVVLVSDAGANRYAARRHVVGADRVSRLLLNLFAREGPRISDIEAVDVNGSFGITMAHPEGPLVITADVDDAGAVTQVWIQMNPDKLTRLSSGLAADR